MNDLEICKRIAEIEGVYTFEFDHIIHGNVMCYHPVVNGLAPQQFNPLTDDALCFKLMVKYSIDLNHDFSGLWCAGIDPTFTFDELVDDYASTVYDKNPNFAICLVIIEAHKDQP